MPGLPRPNPRPTPAPGVLSRRCLLRQLGLAGATLALGTSLAGCNALPQPRSLVQSVAGSAERATGNVTPPKQLHWITPIPPPGDPRAGSNETTRAVADGWSRMLAPWQSANPAITLVRQIVDASDLTRTQLTLAASGGPADVAYTDWGAMLGEAAIVDPLDVGALARKIVPVAFSPHSSGDQVYALPVFLTCLGLYVGHARFQDAELDPGTPLRSWSSFETAAQKLTNHAQQKYGFDVFGKGTPRSGQMRYGPFLWSAGGSFFDDSGAKATWNDPPGLDAIDFLARVSQNYATPGSATAPDETLFANWLDGRAAMFLAGPEPVPRIDARGLAYSVQSVPAYIQGQASSLAMSAGASALFAASKQKDRGLDFVRYLADKDAQVAGLTSAPLLPANSDAGDDAPVFQSNQVLATFLRILREDDVHAFPLGRSHNAEVQEIFRAYLGVALQGLISPELAWNKSAAAATALLAVPVPTPTAKVAP